MTVQEIATRFVAHCAAGEDAEAQKLWSDDVVSIEGYPGPHQFSHGREAVLAKHKWWSENATVHGSTCEGPFVNGEQFSAIFQLDVTMQGHRQTMREVALYTVKDGRVVEERFMPLMAGHAPASA